MLYFIFALFSAMIGTGLSAIIRLELANTGSPFLNHNTQAFNVVITAHAILMSTPMSLCVGSVKNDTII